MITRRFPEKPPKCGIIHYSQGTTDVLLWNMQSEIMISGGSLWTRHLFRTTRQMHPIRLQTIPQNLKPYCIDMVLRKWPEQINMPRYYVTDTICAFCIKIHPMPLRSSSVSKMHGTKKQS